MVKINRISFYLKKLGEKEENTYNEKEDNNSSKLRWKRKPMKISYLFEKNQ